MTDLEGLTRVLLREYDHETDREKVVAELVRQYQFYKNLPASVLEELARAVIEECEASAASPTDPIVREVVALPGSGVTVGKQGVGCRGLGDFIAHQLIARVSETSQEAVLAPTSLDDAGAVHLPEIDAGAGDDAKTAGAPGEGGETRPMLIVSKMEGMHSRLSDFPFLAGFHVTRAALRDLLVKGARPISIMVDVHLGDDADVAKLFDFMGGVSAVCELAGVPITAGSTLRIGGDMVIGTRITGGIAGIGVTRHLLARREIRAGDAILMTEGAGGGTIATTALYGGQPDFVKETLNIKFLEAAQALLTAALLPKIHCMADVTNGGLRGDLFEINSEARTGVEVDEGVVRTLVNERVLALLEDTGTDYLGVSLDALLIYCEPQWVPEIVAAIEGAGVTVARVGTVTESGKVVFKSADGDLTSIPRFRESAYTPVKRVVGEETPDDQEARNARVEAEAQRAMAKRDRVVEYIREQA